MTLADSGAGESQIEHFGPGFSSFLKVQLSQKYSFHVMISSFYGFTGSGFSFLESSAAS